VPQDLELRCRDLERTQQPLPRPELQSALHRHTHAIGGRDGRRRAQRVHLRDPRATATRWSTSSSRSLLPGAHGLGCCVQSWRPAVCATRMRAVRATGDPSPRDRQNFHDNPAHPLYLAGVFNGCGTKNTCKRNPSHRAGIPPPLPMHVTSITAHPRSLQVTHCVYMACLIGRGACVRVCACVGRCVCSQERGACQGHGGARPSPGNLHAPIFLAGRRVTHPRTHHVRYTRCTYAQSYREGCVYIDSPPCKVHMVYLSCGVSHREGGM